LSVTSSLAVYPLCVESDVETNPSLPSTGIRIV